MAKAYQNQRSFPIDIRRMAESLGPNETGTNEQKEQSLKERFPLEEAKEMILDPTLLLDQTGVVLAWYLPGVLSHEFQVSALLKDSNEDPGPRKWLQTSSLQTAILSASLFVMHPNLYSSGREALCKLGQSTEIEEMKSVLSEWSSVYSVTSVIVNQGNPISSGPKLQNSVVGYVGYHRWGSQASHGVGHSQGGTVLWARNGTSTIWKGPSAWSFSVGNGRGIPAGMGDIPVTRGIPMPPNQYYNDETSGCGCKRSLKTSRMRLKTHGCSGLKRLCMEQLTNFGRGDNEGRRVQIPWVFLCKRTGYIGL
ncbi:hypothetical protein BU15DRAFT_69073 [Melanogaster broomeanus]|nr:hypothetical protein BU15DRAFT_69073 [Melanogaster broomeanus]